MQTEGLAASLRLRSSWEAVDLGFRMTSVWWRPIYRLWAVTVVPFCALVIGALHEYPLAAFFVIWWFKPLYDRLVLYVLSEGLFGEVPTLRESLGSWRQMKGGILRFLLWARFSPVRGVSIPVRMLERLKGSACRERCRVLLGREVRVPAGLFFTCTAFEIALDTGLHSLFASIPYAQREIDWETALLSGFDSDFTMLTVVIYVVVMSIVEPFFVGGSFGFYINRRVYLEGWDIDLSFRNLAERCRQGSASAAALTSLVSLALLSFPSPSIAQLADEAVQCESGAQHTAGCIEKVLATDEFRTWIERPVPKSDAEMPALMEGLLTLLGSLFGSLSQLIYVFIPVLVALILAAIVYSIRNRAPPVATAPSEPLPDVRFGLDLRPESLPEDVIAEAAAAFRAGDAAGALSLLYRAALVHLIHARGVRIAESATEGECVRMVRAGAARGLADSFARLTSAWLYCAYAHRPPDADEFEQLCELWSPVLRAEA